MGGGYFGNAGVFLINTVFGLYILIVMLRFLLQLVRGDFYNPVSQFLVKATSPVLVPLRSVIPGLFGIDFASVVLLLVLQVTQIVLVGLIKGYAFQPLGLLVMSIAELASLTLNIFFFSILIQVILSWVNPGTYNPVTSLLYGLNEPLLRPARRLIPPVSGFDFSPLVVGVVLKLLEMTFIAWLVNTGRGMLLG
ncbi:MAG: YggT family protein [Gammaproteobacteria bacterium]|nr:YggT family protein [Gammaproteobacteria bacterium]